VRWHSEANLLWNSVEMQFIVLEDADIDAVLQE
jgi:hypothetical protein